MKVKEALVNKGLRAESIEVESFGEERPVVETMDKAESEINRRVVIQIRTDQEKITVSSN
jgi:outer membrane protein OmpA-like peptidoglycan-associated protein